MALGHETTAADHEPRTAGDHGRPRTTDRADHGRPHPSAPTRPGLADYALRRFGEGLDELAVVEVVVEAAVGEELLVGALFDD